MNRTKTYTLMVFIIVSLIIAVSVFPLLADEKTKQTPNLGVDIIKLPDPRKNSDTSIEEALLKRRSIRNFTDKPLRLAEISQLLWAAQGITDPKGLRTVPSAGALYPLELYIVAGNVNKLSDGIYKYNPDKHKLMRITTGDKRAELCKAALGQPYVKNAAAVIVFSAIYGRTTAKYGERGLRYVHMETGHAAQNVYLQAVSLNLGTLVIGAFHDDKVKEIMRMTDREQPLYIMPIGGK